MNAVDNIHLVKGTIVRIEGRAVIKLCPKCGKEFKSWQVNNRHCSSGCGKLRTTEERFWEKVDKSGSNGCWNWTAGENDDYGVFHGHDGKNWIATRYAWWLIRGEKIPTELNLCHNCPGGDNPKCVNPDHLFVGTDADNVHDMMRKGKMRARGESSGQARLKHDQVIAIRLLYVRNFFGYYRLARLFKISQGEVRHIIIGETWSHLPSCDELHKKVAEFKNSPMYNYTPKPAREWAAGNYPTPTEANPNN